MAEQRIKASPVEMQTLASRLAESNLASARTQEVFTMFCEGRGVSGASFISLDRGEVVVSVPVVPEPAV